MIGQDWAGMDMYGQDWAIWDENGKEWTGLEKDWKMIGKGLDRIRQNCTGLVRI